MRVILHTCLIHASDLVSGFQSISAAFKQCTNNFYIINNIHVQAYEIQFGKCTASGEIKFGYLLGNKITQLIKKINDQIKFSAKFRNKTCRSWSLEKKIFCLVKSYWKLLNDFKN